MPPGRPPLRIGAGALAMGLGISLMHYVGMSAVHLAGPTWHEPPYRRRRGRDLDRRERFRPVGARQPADPAAAVPRRGRAGSGDFRHALHRDGGDAARPAVLRRRRASSGPNPPCRAIRWRCSPRSSRSASRAPFFCRWCRMGAPRQSPSPRRQTRSPPRRRPRRTAMEQAPFTDPPPSRRRAFDPGREGRARARTRRRRHLRDSRQRALHLCPRRRAGIFLQPVDQRARGAARSEGLPESASQLHRLGRPHRAASSDRARPASRNWACLCAAASRLRAPTIARSSSGSARSPAENRALRS